MQSDLLDTPRIKVGKPRGKHPDRRLTALHVRNSAPGHHADGNGLYLVVDGSGARRWLLRTVIRGKRCDLGLGSVQLVSLAEAREEARRLRRMARSGGDPLEERRRARIAVPTFREAALQVHEAHAKTFRSAKHKDDWIVSLELHVFPHFGDRRVDAITTADILKVLSAIWLTKPETARRVRQRLRSVFAWAKVSNFCAGNPVEHIDSALPRQKDEQEHHAALPWAEVPAFVADMREAAATDSVKLALEFLILTAARTNEIIGARWDEIDLEAKLWTIPAARIKAGREHRVPLSTRCVEILQRAHALKDGGPFVFPGRSPQRPLSNTVFLMLMRHRMELKDLTIHGFRSSFKDWCEERANVPHAVSEAALAHTERNKVVAAYKRTDLLEQRRPLMETWCKHVTTPAPAKVVQMRA
jgi:integrase